MHGRLTFRAFLDDSWTSLDLELMTDVTRCFVHPCYHLSKWLSIIRLTRRTGVIDGGFTSSALSSNPRYLKHKSGVRQCLLDFDCGSLNANEYSHVEVDGERK